MFFRLETSPSRDTDKLSRTAANGKLSDQSSANIYSLVMEKKLWREGNLGLSMERL